MAAQQRRRWQWQRDGPAAEAAVSPAAAGRVVVAALARQRSGDAATSGAAVDAEGQRQQGGS